MFISFADRSDRKEMRNRQTIPVKNWIVISLQRLYKLSADAFAFGGEIVIFAYIYGELFPEFENLLWNHIYDSAGELV